MKNLQILYVDTDGLWRGGQDQLFTLMAGMNERGHLVHVAAPRDSPLVRKSKGIGLRTLDFHQNGEVNLRALLRFWHIAGTREFDIVHFNTPHPILLGGLVSKLRGIPLRVASRRVNFPLRSRLSRIKYNWILESIITVSRSIQNTLREGGVRPELIEVVYEGVDLNWIDRQRPSEVNLPQKGLTVGTVAHLSSEKGHRILLEAATEVLERFPDTNFVLVGDGELELELKKRARDLGIDQNVVFTGFHSDSEAVMKIFDVFCLPSLSEGLSSAILAAMANRLPVVATSAGGIPELVVQGKTGVLVPPADAQGLACALSTLLESLPLRKQLGFAARRRIEEKFTLKQKLDLTEKLYYELLGRKK